jgi:tetratricopeptide (TPR) repeat protein
MLLPRNEDLAPGREERTARGGNWVLRGLYVLAAVACLACAAGSAVEARADWLRRNPTRARISEAIRLDPWNPYAYTVLAEYFEAAGKNTEAENAWRSALERNAHDAEACIRLALLREQDGAVVESERLLLRAAGMSHTWLPRWALVNFYARHERTDDCYRWSRLAMDRGSADVAALFPILDDMGAPCDRVLNLLPRNRFVIAAWLDYRLRTRSPDAAIESAAMRLASLIPQTTPGWPGTGAVMGRSRVYPADDSEAAVLLRAVDRLHGNSNGAAAVRLWNLLADRGLLEAEHWETSSPTTNSRFHSASPGDGLDWRVRRSDEGDTVINMGPDECVIRFNGRHPERLDLIAQSVYLPAGRNYRLVSESRTEDLAEAAGLQWELRDRLGKIISVTPLGGSERWRRTAAPVPPAANQQVAQLVLAYSRPAGAMRAEGAVHIRLAGMERCP